MLEKTKEHSFQWNLGNFRYIKKLYNLKNIIWFEKLKIFLKIIDNMDN